MTVPDWQRLHRDLVVVDTHNDLLMPVAARPVAEWSTFFRQRWLPQLRAGGVDVQVLPVYIDEAYRPEGALRQTLRMIECAHRVAEGNADAVALCTTAAEIEAALASDRIALVLALESAPGVGDDVALLETLFRLGVRVASLAHFGRTPLADGSGEDATGSRLTRAGVEALALMESLGMVFDVSHLGIGGVDHVLELATRPVLASHSSARALHDHHRNLSDAQIRGIVASGGVVCVNFFGLFLAERHPSLDHLLDHIEHVAEVAGIDHVGIGPDFIKELHDDLTPPCCEGQLAAAAGVTALEYVPGLEGPEGLPLVTRGLLERGWDGASLEKVLGGNVMRLLHSGLGVPGQTR